jgi:threonine dehydrogenase-like Zn-dependent dehydrogenase
VEGGTGSRVTARKARSLVRYAATARQEARMTNRVIVWGTGNVGLHALPMVIGAGRMR